MLNENIKVIRKAKGLSQEELAIKLNVVRQTISKWEQGLSVPDADMLISISEVFETPEKLEVINMQLAYGKAARQKAVHWLFILLCAVIVAGFAVLTVLNSPYLSWDYSNAETAAAGVMLHAFEWLFVRTAPFALMGAVIGACLTRKKV